MEQTNIALHIENLSKKKKNTTLLQPCNVTLPKGKILALCGGNGAGKSTLIRLLTGILQPTTGSVTMHGFDQQTQPRQYLEQFGYMPDHFQFQASMTTKETIAFYAQMKKISKNRYEEVLKEVGLLDKLHVKVGTFSKGMNQRLLLAQALLAQPQILLLDEPTNGLDPYWIDQFSNRMLQAKQQGQTIIFSTHDLHVAEYIADEVVFLNQGHIIHKGSINPLLDIGLYETFKHYYMNTHGRNQSI